MKESALQPEPKDIESLTDHNTSKEAFGTVEESSKKLSGIKERLAELRKKDFEIMSRLKTESDMAKIKELEEEANKILDEGRLLKLEEGFLEGTFKAKHTTPPDS
jgi:hypothetical protein